jgi:hypothetical protein
VSTNDDMTMRDYAPILSIVAILVAFLLLITISKVYHHGRYRLSDLFFRRGRRRPVNSVYSQLTSANEFDLN